MKKTKTITLALLGAAFLSNQSSAQNAAKRTIPSTFDKERNDSIVQTDTLNRSQRHASSTRRSNTGTRVYPSRTTIVLPPRTTSTKTQTRTYTVKPSINKPISTTTYSKSSSYNNVSTVTRGGFGRSGSSISASS